MKKWMRATLFLLMVGLVSALVWHNLYRQTHTEINGIVYDIRETYLDLRDRNISTEEFEALREKLPDADILWTVPFQDRCYNSDVTEITVDALSPEDVQMLRYLTDLEVVHADNCRDYEELESLMEKFPDCKVDYMLHIGDRTLKPSVQALALDSGVGTAEELENLLRYGNHLSRVLLNDPEISGEVLCSLREKYPDVILCWNKAFRGELYEMNLTSLDFSEKTPETVEELEKFAAYFPDLELVEVMNCCLPNEEMAAYRDRVRDQYQVVWDVQVGSTRLRTDETKFSPGNEFVTVTDENIGNLRYCEDMIAVDLGHVDVGNTEWVVGTPHLRYLILGDSSYVQNEDIIPIGTLQELVWLEIFICPVTEVSCLKTCSGLRHLLLSGCYVDVDPLGEMTWLDNLWLLRSGIDEEEAAYLEEHLPDTHIETMDTYQAHSRGWRQLTEYFKMRDALNMYYMTG